jgi:Asp-tRNA(Asn)/Glu-tRNA(Gln) amidotransferase A subunit family amidase
MRAGWCLGAGCEPHPEVVAAVELADFHITSRDTMLELGSPAIAAMLEVFDLVGPAVDLAGMYALLAERASQLRRWQALLTDDVDVLVLPVAMEPAWPAADDMTSPSRLEQIFAANTPLVAFNFLGLPVAAQPTSVMNGRPAGVQIVSRRFAENVALDAAATIEQVLGPAERPVRPLIA